MLLELAGSAGDSSRADILVEISFNLINTQPDSARLLGEQALQIAKAQGYVRLQASAHNALGWMYAQHGPLSKAEEQLDSALILYRQEGAAHEEAIVLGNLGWVFEKRGDLVTALGSFQSAYKIAEHENDSNMRAVQLYSMGAIYSKLQEPEKARDFFRRSLDLETALGRKDKQATCVLGLANSFQGNGETTQAQDYYEQALALYRVLNDKFGQGIVAENLGNMLYDTDPEEAIENYELALAFYDSLDSDQDRAYVLYGLGKSQLKLHNGPKAERELRRGMELAETVGIIGLLKDFHYGMAELHSMLGQSDSTLHHFKMYEAIKDSIQGEKSHRELARLRTEFETEQKEKENELLRVKNKEQQERLLLRNLQLYGSIALGFFALVAALLFWRNLKNKRKHLAVLDGLNHQLAQNNQEINEINALLEMRVLRGQMNPHFIYNCLNSAAQLTQAGRNIEALAYLQGFARLLRTVLDYSVKDLVNLEEELNFLRQYLKLEEQRMERLEVSLECADELLDAEIPALLVQPFVENAIWHGLAHKGGVRKLAIKFKDNGAALHCTITDNGVGRKKAAEMTDNHHHSLGMELTSERIRLLAKRMQERGSYKIEDLSENGVATGTRITLLLPLETD